MVYYSVHSLRTGHYMRQIAKCVGRQLTTSKISKAAMPF